jgi:hypothetical protein
MIISVSTVRFKGAGSINCRLCSHQTVFPDNANAVIYRVGGWQRILSVTDRSTLHRCGVEYEWECPNCPIRPDPEQIRIAAERYNGAKSGYARKLYERWMSCDGCGTRLVQRPVERLSTACG